MFMVVCISHAFSVYSAHRGSKLATEGDIRSAGHMRPQFNGIVGYSGTQECNQAAILVARASKAPVCHCPAASVSAVLSAAFTVDVDHVGFGASM